MIKEGNYREMLIIIFTHHQPIKIRLTAGPRALHESPLGHYSDPIRVEDTNCSKVMKPCWPCKSHHNIFLQCLFYLFI